MARGDLAAARRELDEARSFGATHDVPLGFINSVSLGELAFLRGDLAGAEARFSGRTEAAERTFLSGWRDACLFAFRAESDPRRYQAGRDLSGQGRDGTTGSCNPWAWNAWTERHWKLPVAGKANPQGAWFALERSVIGLAWLGKRDEAGALRPLTEEAISTGVCVAGNLAPFQTAAGAAAACSGDWSAAEQHHLTAILGGTASFDCHPSNRLGPLSSLTAHGARMVCDDASRA